MAANEVYEIPKEPQSSSRSSRTRNAPKRFLQDTPATVITTKKLKCSDAREVLSLPRRNSRKSVCAKNPDLMKMEPPSDFEPSVNHINVVHNPSSLPPALDMPTARGAPKKQGKQSHRNEDVDAVEFLASSSRDHRVPPTSLSSSGLQYKRIRKIGTKIKSPSIDKQSEEDDNEDDIGKSGIRRIGHEPIKPSVRQPSSTNIVKPKRKREARVKLLVRKALVYGF